MEGLLHIVWLPDLACFAFSVVWCFPSQLIGNKNTWSTRHPCCDDNDCKSLRKCTLPSSLLEDLVIFQRTALKVTGTANFQLAAGWATCMESPHRNLFFEGNMGLFNVTNFHLSDTKTAGRAEGAQSTSERWTVPNTRDPCPDPNAASYLNCATYKKGSRQ